MSDCEKGMSYISEYCANTVYKDNKTVCDFYSCPLPSYEAQSNEHLNRHVQCFLESMFGGGGKGDGDGVGSHREHDHL